MILVPKELIEHKISGLNESTSYDFQVTAVNGFTGTAANYSTTEPVVDETQGRHN